MEELKADHAVRVAEFAVLRVVWAYAAVRAVARAVYAAFSADACAAIAVPRAASRAVTAVPTQAILAATFAAFVMIFAAVVVALLVSADAKGTASARTLAITPVARIVLVNISVR